MKDGISVRLGTRRKISTVQARLALERAIGLEEHYRIEKETVERPAGAGGAERRQRRVRWTLFR